MIFMKNKRIIYSWNTIDPDESAQKRMLSNILEKNHFQQIDSEHTEVKSETVITEKTSVRSDNPFKHFLHTSIPAAACLAFLLGAGKILYTINSVTKNEKIGVPETNHVYTSTVSQTIQETAESKKSVISVPSAITSEQSCSETHTSTDSLPPIPHTEVYSETPNTDKTIAYTDTPKVPENAKTPDTESYTGTLKLETSGHTEKPALTEPPVSETSAPESGKQITVEDILALSDKKDDLKFSDIQMFESEDIGSGLYVLSFPVYNSDFVLLTGFERTMPDSLPCYAILVHKDNLYSSDSSKWIDIRYSDRDKIIDFIS